MVKIKQQLVSQHIINTRSHGYGNTCEYIAIHETANVGKGANAQSHANLQINGNSREASWQYTVDDEQAIQSFDDKVKCWHVGDSNSKAIAIEICVNSDGDFKKAIQNAVELTQILMKRHNIPIDKVKQHNFFTGKNCPTNLRNGSKGINWNEFKSMLSGKTYTPPKQQTGSHTVSKPTQTSESVVDYLKSKGIDSSFNNRSKLAKEHGIANYSGTSSQNNTLLSKLKADKPIQPASSKPVNKPTSNYKGTSLVDYLKSINQSSAYANRAKLASQYGISGYKGTGAQNTQLLNKMRGSSGISSKSVSQMADEIIRGKGIPNGHEARRKHFGVSKAKYEQARKEVNRRL